MPILDKYSTKQTPNRPYKAGSTAIFIAGVLLLIAGQASENHIQEATTSPTVEKWVSRDGQPKRMTLTHKDGRTLSVFLVKRNQTHITMQRTNDGKIFQYPIANLSEKDQTTINTCWDSQTMFPYYRTTRVVRRSCGIRRSCR